jgi:hypothetical protein
MTPCSDTLLSVQLCQGEPLSTLYTFSAHGILAQLLLLETAFSVSTQTSAWTSPRRSPSARICIDAHQHVVVDAFQPLTHMEADATKLLQNIFPQDPTNTFSFYSRLDDERTERLPFKLQCYLRATYLRVIWWRTLSVSIPQSSRAYNQPRPSREARGSV